MLPAFVAPQPILGLLADDLLAKSEAALADGLYVGLVVAGGLVLVRIASLAIGTG